jgi:hypothetical protein
MKKFSLVFLLGMVLVAVILCASCQPGGDESVLLQGAVTIGPIWPVEQPGESRPVSPEVFSSRYLIIYDETGEKLVREVYFTQIGQTAVGYYTAQIAPGTYVIDINRLGVDSADGLPVTIDVAVDETVTIDVDIDTGIR